MTTKQDLLARLEALPPRPWRIDEVSRTEIVPGLESVVGALRAADNRNVIEPAQESASMVHGLANVLEFIKDAPDIIEGLLEALNAEKPA